MKKWQHLKRPFEEIKDATNNFKTCIGKGGYGLVYEGELSIDGQDTKVAVKRLNEHLGQGLKEFLTEIQLLFGQRHPNLISLLAYCDQGKEKIIVYEYAERGSLDRYIIRKPGSNYNYTPLTWLQRLKICADAARGLDHLHNHVGEHQTIIHRDIKSANILLDDKWVAKISDLGLSKLSLAGLDRSVVISHACGTPGYCEPEYIQSGIVKKESDVYSFGIVLFEVLCGRLCTIKDDDGVLLSGPLAKYYYEKEKLDDIIDPSLREQMNSYAMRRFSSIAYECLDDDREQRPSMDVVTKEIEEAFKVQEEYELEIENKPNNPTVVFDSEEYWKRKLPNNIEDIIEKLDSRPVYATSKELFSLLRKGVFFDHGHRFFQINNDGIKCEMMSPRTFLKWKSRQITRSSGRGGRGGRGPHSTSLVGEYPHIEEINVRCKISTSMLSLGIKYAANLVFSFGEWEDPDSSLHLSGWDGPGSMSRGMSLPLSGWVWIKWQCQDLRVSATHFAQKIEYDDDYNDSNSNRDIFKNTKFKTTLWHFVNHDKNADFEITINRLLGGKAEEAPFIMIHGFEFRPVEMKKQNNGTEESEGVVISKESIDWEKNMPAGYKHIIHRLNPHLEFTTKRELYFLLCAGIHIDNGRKWFSLCKSTGKKCVMLSAIEILRNDPKYAVLGGLSLSESRFKEVIQLQDAPEHNFILEIESWMLSSTKLDACYLVFKFVDAHTSRDNRCLLEASCQIKYKESEYVHLKVRESIDIPIIKPLRNHRYRDPKSIPKTKGYLPKTRFAYEQNWMEHRNDGWMEVILIKNFSYHFDTTNSLSVKLRSVIGTLPGIIVQGVEFRPIDDQKGEKFPFNSYRGYR